MHVTGFNQQDKNWLRRFVDSQTYVYHHLDWIPYPAWLTEKDNVFSLAWEGDYLRGVMVVSPPHHQTAWLRLITLPIDEPHETFNALWGHTCQQLAEQQVRYLAVMTAHEWLKPLLAGVGFEYLDTVINLRCEQPFAEYARLPSIKIRSPRFWETPRLLAVDHAAFGALWQIRLPEIQELRERVHYCKVALYKERIVGYQISLIYRHGMHLGRLAIHPDYQGRGIGRALVTDILRESQRRELAQVTVNTQQSNTISQHLYVQLGFEREYDDVPIQGYRFG